MMVMLNEPVEVIALFDKTGMPMPYKFRIEDSEGSLLVYKVDSILFRKEENVNKSSNIIVRCKWNIDGVLKEYELKYDVTNTRWSLYCI
jgi:hypothetical protein